MSLVSEIHSQSPAVRHTLFILSAGIVISAIGFFTFNSMQHDIYVAMHPDPADQAAFFASQDAQRPQPLSAIAHMADSMMANIGSFIGWKNNAGFDSTAAKDNHSDSVHLLPVSK